MIPIGSFCSGIGAPEVAARGTPFHPVFFSEIDAFPSAVLAHHWPDVPNLGDFTAIDDRWLQRIQVLIAGTPCQAFSFAGLRKSLEDARGNLTLEFVRKVHAAKSLFCAAWENVPGVLSTDDNAFGCFLGALVGADDPLCVPGGGRWPDAGMVAGPLGRSAWRILDAQYFGLAQRRRRVILIFCPAASPGDPAAILFEREGVHGDFAESEEEGQDIAGTLSARTSGGGGLGTDFDLGGGLQVAGPLTAGMAASASRMPHEQGALVPVLAGTLQANGKAAGSATQQDAESGLLVPIAQTFVDVAPALTQNPYGDNDGRETLLVANTLKAEGFDASEDGTGRTNLIPVCFSGNDHGADATYDLAPTLRAGNHRHSHANAGTPPAVAYAIQERAVSENPAAGPDGAGFRPEIAYTLEARQQTQAVSFSVSSNSNGFAWEGDIAPCLDTSTGKSGNQMTGVRAPSGVRRLVPPECARLQGFPDDHTQIIYRGKPAADGPQYKAYGNSMAVAKIRWLWLRILAEMLRCGWLERTAA